jgi:hypothetical protein
MDKLVHGIEEMGFSKDEARAALELTKRNQESAIVLLLENPDHVKNHINNIQRRPNHESTVNINPNANTSLNIGKRPLSRQPSTSSLQRISRSSSGTSLNTGSPGMTRKFSPIAFIQQQQAKLSSHSHDSPLFKVSQVIGKAIQSLGQNTDECSSYST